MSRAGKSLRRAIDAAEAGRALRVGGERLQRPLAFAQVEPVELGQRDVARAVA